MMREDGKRVSGYKTKSNRVVFARCRFDHEGEKVGRLRRDSHLDVAGDKIGEKYAGALRGSDGIEVA